MSDKKSSPPNVGYELSTDYELLWDLIGQGHQVAAWLLYPTYAPYWDIVQVRRTYWDGELGRYAIGVRGIGYEGLDDKKDGFVSVCQKYNLHFVPPTKTIESNGR